MRKSNFITRLNTAIAFVIHGKSKCRMMSCGKCGSTIITSITKEPVETKIIDDKHHIDVLWADVDKCLKCGAVCYETQYWNFDGNVKALGVANIDEN